MRGDKDVPELATYSNPPNHCLGWTKGWMSLTLLCFCHPPVRIHLFLDCLVIICICLNIWSFCVWIISLWKQVKLKYENLHLFYFSFVLTYRSQIKKPKVRDFCFSAIIAAFLGPWIGGFLLKILYPYWGKDYSTILIWPKHGTKN